MGDSSVKSLRWLSDSPVSPIWQLQTKLCRKTAQTFERGGLDEVPTSDESPVKATPSTDAKTRVEDHATSCGSEPAVDA